MKGGMSLSPLLRSWSTLAHVVWTSACWKCRLWRFQIGTWCTLCVLCLNSGHNGHYNKAFNDFEGGLREQLIRRWTWARKIRLIIWVRYLHSSSFIRFNQWSLIHLFQPIVSHLSFNCFFLAARLREVGKDQMAECGWPFFASMTSWCVWKRILYAGNYKFPQDAYLENMSESDTQQILIRSRFW